MSRTEIVTDAANAATVGSSPPPVTNVLVIGMGTPAFGKERRVVRSLREMKSVRPFFLTSKWEDGSVSRLLRDNNFEYAATSFGYLGRARLRWTLVNLVQMPALFATVLRSYRQRQCRAVLIAALATFVNALPAFVALKWLLGARLVFYLGDISTNTRANRLVGRVVRHLADDIIANSSAVKRGLVELGIRADQVRVIYNGVDVERFRSALPLPFRSRFGWPEDTLLIAFAGQFSAAKGVWDFVHAAERVLETEPRCRFLFLGKQDEQNPCVRELTDHISARGLGDRVVFAGWMEQMEPAYAAVDVMVMPSRPEEPAANVNIEAMAAGVPVVATRTGGTPELIVDGGTGLLVDPAAPEQLTQAILLLARDPDLRKRLGLTGQARVRELFDSRKNAQVIEKILVR